MRFLILNTDYAAFTQWLYAQRQGLENEPYAEQHRVRMATRFGVADFYSRNLRRWGQVAEDVIINSPMQAAWGKTGQTSEWHVTLGKQIQAFKPDAIINLAMDSLSGEVLRTLAGPNVVLIGQHAAAFTPTMRNVDDYQILLSSLPPVLDRFKAMRPDGLCRIEPLALAFEDTILDEVPAQERTVPVSFVGGVGGPHYRIIEMLDRVRRTGVSMELYGYGGEGLAGDLSAQWHGPLWGLDMYRLYGRSKIVLNAHAGWAGPHRNNMRMYEAGGMGAFVACSMDEYYSAVKDDHYRELRAQEWRDEVLDKHTYYRRMEELLDVVYRV